MEMNKGASPPSVFSRPPQPPAASAAITAPPQSAPTVAGSPAQRSAEGSALESRRRSGAQWFFWIAALSVVNSVVAFTGLEWRFIIGLGATQLVHEIAQHSGGAGIKAGLGSLIIIAFLAFLGQRAVQGHCWAFMTGMVMYGLDGAIFLLAQDWVGVGFHAFAICMMLRGYLAARQLSAVNG